jgi:hypothetical protein
VKDMDINEEMIRQLVDTKIKRPSYIISVLEFQLGRKPTQEEIDQVNRDFKLRQAVYLKWLAKQPLKIRLNREERMVRVMEKRYNVPKWLLDAYYNEVVWE